MSELSPEEKRELLCELFVQVQLARLDLELTRAQMADRPVAAKPYDWKRDE